MSIFRMRRNRALFASLRAAQRTLPRRLGLTFLALMAAVSTLPAASVAHADPRDDFYSPVVTVNPACGSGQQYFPFVDLNGQASDYTYANGSQWCVRADWYITPPLNSYQYCQIFFYVPNGNATANLSVGLFTPVGDPARGEKTYRFSTNLSEASVSGPQQIWPLPAPQPAYYSNIAQINIGDNNGEAYPQMIGWGATDSVEVKCP